MTLLVYVTEECTKKARQYALLDEIERFMERVEKTQSTCLFDPFPPPYLVKKKLGGRQGRLIAERCVIGEDVIIAFLTIMIRGDRSYEDQFGRDPIGYGSQHFNHLVSNTMLESYIISRTQAEPLPAKPTPSEEEFAFLYEAFSHRNLSSDEDMIYETNEWKEAVAEDRISNQLVRFAEPCLHALDLKPGFHRVDIPRKPGWGMWLFRGPGLLLLIMPITEANADLAEQIKNHYSNAFSHNENVAHLLRSCQRAYPAYMVADEETWVEIEKEPVANMALSPEESEVLISARNCNGAFPLFINGRAGSGKSTILQYLFTDLMYYYLARSNSNVMAPPIYLTSNGDLLQVARSFVERVLTSEASFRENAKSNILDDKKHLLDEAFREFRPFLLSLVPTNECRERFAPHNFVDYRRFHQLWSEWFGQEPEALRDFGPDVCWHVIRSYIKGMLSEAFMDVDEYDQLPENQVTVTKSTFINVFDRVWERRYRPLHEENDLWDDQDLARYILDNDLAHPFYPAVVCDEAQDFTRIELELLLRLNLFSNRSIPAHDLCRVPFAFAGDQFQTLNPTGFRWEAIKVAFIEKFIDALDPAGRSGRAELNYHELQFNYRSTLPIVLFSNGVQALRAAALKMPELRPQRPWSCSTGVFPVVWFCTKDIAFWKKYKECESFVMLVPCNEGEEANFVQMDPILRDHVRTEDGIPLNVLSAARAKGREYPGVFVYGFGAASPAKLLEVLQVHSDDSDLGRSNLLPLEYFFSRLYVAVSRAKQRLVILDTDEAIANFWELLSREEMIGEVVRLADRGRNIWTVDERHHEDPSVQGMSMGNVDDLGNETAGDPLENAKAFEEDGRSRRDSFLLRQASLAYRAASALQKAKECRALALELEGLYLEAGNCFLDAGLIVPEAVRSLWKGGKAGWEQLLAVGMSTAQVARETEFKLASAILGEGVTPQFILEVLDEVASRMTVPSFALEVSSNPAWSKGIEDVANTVLKSSSILIGRGLEEILERIESEGVLFSDRMMGHVHSLTGSHSKAVQRWEKAGETTSDLYLRAKASSDSYPDSLLSLSKLKDFFELTNQYSYYRGVPLTSEHWRVVALAYLELSRFEDALLAAWEAEIPSLLRNLTLNALSVGQSEIAACGLRASVITMVYSGEWESLVKYVTSREFIPDKNWSTPVVRHFVATQVDHLQFGLVAALARSDEFAELQWRIQKFFTDFLRVLFNSSDSRWRSQVSVEEAGASFERGGRFSDALVFYEHVLKVPSFSKMEKEFSRVRWLVSKNRQLEYMRNNSSNTHKVVELEKEIVEAQRISKIERLNDLPRFPILGPILTPFFEEHVTSQQVTPLEIQHPDHPTVEDTSTPTTDFVDNTSQTEDSLLEPTTSRHIASEASLHESQSRRLAERVSAQVGDVQIVLSRKLGRCNFTHSATMITAYLNLQEATANGEYSWTELGPAEWECDGLGIKVHLRNDILQIENTEYGSILCFQNIFLRN